MTNMLFETGKVFAVGSRYVFDEAVNKATLSADLHAYAHGVVDGDEREAESNGKDGSVSSFTMRNSEHERSV